MGVQTASVLYPVNSTTLDTGTGIDIRLLDSAQAGATDNSQTATATHTQDNQGRVFDPASTTNTNRSVVVLRNNGWRLRLTEDMTPSDDTNCDVLLPAQTVTLNVRVTINQSGGTYVSGTYAPTWAFTLWRYDPATDTGVSLGTGQDSGTSWDYTPATGDLGTFKNVAITLAIAKTEFAQGEVPHLEIGVGVGTIPNPTIGTATWTYTLSVDDANTNLTLAEVLASVCGMAGTSSGTGDATGAAAIVLPTAGTSAGAATASGALAADAVMVGTSAGGSTTSGALVAFAEFAGTAAGTSTVSGSFAGVTPTVGTVDIGAGGATINPVFCVSD